MNRQVRRTLRVLLTVAGVFVILAILVRWGVRDPYPDYEKNLSLLNNIYILKLLP